MAENIYNDEEPETPATEIGTKMLSIYHHRFLLILFKGPYED